MKLKFHFCLENGTNHAFFVYICPLINITINIVQNLTITGNSVDGVLGIRTHDCRMEGGHKSTGLWRQFNFCLNFVHFLLSLIWYKIAMFVWVRPKINKEKPEKAHFFKKYTTQCSHTRFALRPKKCERFFEIK